MSIEAIAAAMSAHPEIHTIYHGEPDGLIPHDSWIIRLRGTWMADDFGNGETLPAAYADALAKYPRDRAVA